MPKRFQRTRWTWWKVSSIHQSSGSTCTGRIYSYRYRYYGPADSSYERCVGLAWCTLCREYSGAMVHVPRQVELWDALAALPEAERERLSRSEWRLIEHLDRLARRGAWPE
jgi:hypothetical protein